MAAVNGPAVGGAGFNLALACDVRIAAESAVFDARFIQIPIHPGGGHTWMLNEVVGPQAAAAVTLFGAAVDVPAPKSSGWPGPVCQTATCSPPPASTSAEPSHAPPPCARSPGEVDVAVIGTVSRPRPGDGTRASRTADERA